MSDVLSMLKDLKKKHERKDFFKTERPNDGKHAYRFLYKEGVSPLFVEYGKHWIKNDAGKLVATTSCPSVIDGEDCPVCNAISAGQATAEDDETLNTLKLGKVAVQSVFQVVRKDGSSWSEPYMLGVSGRVRDEILGALEQYVEETDGKDPFDPKEGAAIYIERKGTGLDTKYTISLSLKKAPFDPSILTQLKDLDDAIRSPADLQVDKALTAVGAITGSPIAIASSSVAGALTGPSDTKSAAGDLDNVLEDDDLDLEDVTTDEVKADDVVEASAEVLSEDVAEDDIEAMLADL